MEIDVRKLLRDCKTYNKFVIMELMSDGLPRKKPEICKDFVEVENRKVMFTTIRVSIESLEVCGMITLQKSGYYTTDYFGSRIKFDKNRRAVIKSLRLGERTPTILMKMTKLDEEEFGEAVDKLIEDGYVELVDSDKLPDNAQVLRMVSKTSKLI